MRYNELSESRMAPLFHLMNCSKATHVVETDTMEARWEHDIPTMGKVKGNSFTRNRSFRFGDDYFVRLTIDQDALSRRHKLIPLDAERAFTKTIDSTRDVSDRTHNRTQYAEEFVVGTIREVHRYIEKIEILPTSHRPDMVYWFVNQAKRYSEKYSIPVEIHPKVEKRLADWVASWEEDDD